MDRSRLLKSGLLLFLACVLSSPIQPQGDVTPKDFFQQLASGSIRESDGALGALRWSRMVNQLASEAPDEIKAVLPILLSCLESPSRDLRGSGVLALQSLAIRPDGLAVMGSAIPALERLLFDSDIVVASISVNTLSVIKPTPPATVRATLLQFLNGDRGSVQVKVSAVLSLVRLGVNQPETVEAISRFYQRQPDILIRVGVVNALGTGRLKDPKLLDILKDALASGDDDLKQSAIFAAANAGEPAMTTVRPRLSELQNDPTVRPDVRELDRKILNGIQP